jgi:hypothetical protein
MGVKAVVMGVLRAGGISGVCTSNSNAFAVKVVPGITAEKLLSAAFQFCNVNQVAKLVDL